MPKRKTKHESAGMRIGVSEEVEAFSVAVSDRILAVWMAPVTCDHGEKHSHDADDVVGDVMVVGVMKKGKKHAEMIGRIRRYVDDRAFDSKDEKQFFALHCKRPGQEGFELAVNEFFGSFRIVGHRLGAPQSFAVNGGPEKFAELAERGLLPPWFHVIGVGSVGGDQPGGDAVN